MGRLARDARIETREARSRLRVEKEPYWKQIHLGLSVGYFKGPHARSWVVRRRSGDHYEFETLGTADDFQDANDLDVLSFAGACRTALALSDQKTKLHAGHGYTVADACRDYMLWFRAHRKSAGDTQNAIDARILPALGKRKVADLSTTELTRWQQGLVEAPVRKRGKSVVVDRADPEAMRRRKATANRILTVLKAALNFAYTERKAPSDDAWRRIKAFREVDAPRVRYLQADEGRRLLNACEGDFRALVSAALVTGCRYGELTRLRCEDYVPDAGAVRVRASKGGKPRHVPLTEEGRRLFDSLTAGKPGDALMFTRADGEPWDKSHQSRPMREACDRAGIVPAAGFHDLRHTFGSLLAMRGTPLQVIAAAMGHADTRMTERHYAHLLPSFIFDTVRANLPSFGVDAGKICPLKTAKG